MTQPTMGEYLHEARRKRRISIERAAEDTRIKKEFLIRMESDEFDFLAPAYVRGFLRTYARFLHVDPQPILDEFDRRHEAAVDASQIVALQRRARKIPKQPVRLNRAALLGLGVLLILTVLAVVGLAAGPDEPRRDATGVAAASPRPRLTVITPTPAARPTPSTTAVPIATGATPSFADGITVEIVAAEDDCWVEVTSDGTIVFSETIATGGAESFEAESEMTLVLGFPAGVELIVNGTNVGAPGGVDPVKLTLPDDFGSLV